MTAVFHKITNPFASAETYLNLAYHVVNIAFGLIYYLIFQICLALAWGLVSPNIALFASLDQAPPFKVAAVIVAGILVIPVLVWLLQLFVLPEQWVARVLLKENIALDPEIWSRRTCLLCPGRLFLSPATWKRVLFTILKIPMGILSLLVFFAVLLPVLALLAMPLAYLAGFRGLIIGPLEFDSMGESILAFFAGILLLPLSFLAVNTLAKLCGWSARVLLSNPAAG